MRGTSRGQGVEAFECDRERMIRIVPSNREAQIAQARDRFVEVGDVRRQRVERRSYGGLPGVQPDRQEHQQISPGEGLW